MGRELTAPNSQELHYASWLPILHVWFPSRKKFVRQNSRSASRHSKAYNNATKENDHRQGTPGEAQGLRRPPRKHKLKKKKKPHRNVHPWQLLKCTNCYNSEISRKIVAQAQVAGDSTGVELPLRTLGDQTTANSTTRSRIGTAPGPASEKCRHWKQSSAARLPPPPPAR